LQKVVHVHLLVVENSRFAPGLPPENRSKVNARIGREGGRHIEEEVPTGADLRRPVEEKARRLSDGKSILYYLTACQLLVEDYFQTATPEDSLALMRACEAVV
jgi:hypothetical protein